MINDINLLYVCISIQFHQKHFPNISLTLGSAEFYSKFTN